VLSLLDQPEWARSLARAAHATCEACTWPSVRERWLDAYRSAMVAAERSVRRRSAVEGHDAAAVPRQAQAFVERRAHPRGATAKRRA